MRDLYNAVYVFKSTLPNVSLCHGVYHPEDVFYLSSLSFSPGLYLKFNRDLVGVLWKAKSVIFCSVNSMRMSLGDPSLNVSDEMQGTQYVPIPIDLPGVKPKRILPVGKPIKIVCISRFVQFKIGAIFAIVRYVSYNKNFELLLIGHGPFYFLLKMYRAIFLKDRITIKVGVTPKDLDGLIDCCHIGYAQGTSILEIAKRGLPVIIAPYSNLLDISNCIFV